MTETDFPSAFHQLTGNWPLRWQERLFDEHFAKGTDHLPSVIDLPTGLGKTMVMAIWLIARADKLNVPTRLIYVVDRRTVVDQATDLAEELVKRWKKNGLDGDPPAISTLRGQLADNREWSRDLSKPAIIIGTVDLIGSALLFSGYRSGYKRRPLEAGLLGQDSLLVLDEAHLSKPFEKLLESIERFNKTCGTGISPGKPMCVIRMSATSGNSIGSRPFTLQFGDDGNLTGEDANDGTVTERFGASKTLSVIESEKPVETIAAQADKLATDKPGSRIVIFVQTPRQVADVRKALEKKKKDYATRVAQLTGTMRGLERDELVDTRTPLKDDDHERRVMQRFLQPDNDPSQGECFLISTSAGEVGFDLNADHLIGDEAPLDSWIQRLGRVNRRGKGVATVILIRKSEPADKTDFDKACLATSKLLTNGMDVSPKGLATFKKSLKPEQVEQASSPKPGIVQLTDILLDAWSMTSITEPMPGRPEVAPWLRGVAEWEPPQTIVAWRAELDLDGFAGLDLEDIEEWFDTHRILPHETLSVNTGDVANWFKERWAELASERQSDLAARPVIVDRAGMEVIALDEVINRLSRKTADADAFLRGAELIVPASFGGILRGVGLLDPAVPKGDKAEDKRSHEEQITILKAYQDSIDVADVRGRYREKVEKFPDGQAVATVLDPKAVKPAKYVRTTFELMSDDEHTLRLISYVPRREKPEVGAKPQTLQAHVGAVRRISDQIIEALQFTMDDPIRRALELAADWHDQGKVRERWQRLLVFPKGFIKTNDPMGKSGGEMKRDTRGYRHEFGSLREFTDAFNAGRLVDNAGGQINEDIFDLAMHLIATHHGRGRPHFPKGGFDPDCETRSDEIHTDCIRRFARLQRKYGWWRLAWLENLLRCADAMASAATDGDDEPTCTEGGAA